MTKRIAQGSLALLLMVATFGYSGFAFAAEGNSATGSADITSINASKRGHIAVDLEAEKFDFQKKVENDKLQIERKKYGPRH